MVVARGSSGCSRSGISVRVHRLLGAGRRAAASLGFARPFFAIALPAGVTQLSTPFGNALLTGADRAARRRRGRRLGGGDADDGARLRRHLRALGRDRRHPRAELRRRADGRGCVAPTATRWSSAPSIPRLPGRCSSCCAHQIIDGLPASGRRAPRSSTPSSASRRAASSSPARSSSPTPPSTPSAGRSGRRRSTGPATGSPCCPLAWALSRAFGAPGVRLRPGARRRRSSATVAAWAGWRFVERLAARRAAWNAGRRLGQPARARPRLHHGSAPIPVMRAARGVLTCCSIS